MRKYLSDPPINMKPAGIFKGGDDGIFDVSSVGDPVPGPATNERRVTITCDEDGCKEQLFSVGHQDSYSLRTDLLSLGWTNVDEEDYCPKHSGEHVAEDASNWREPAPGFDLDATILEIAEAGLPSPCQPDNPVAHPLPTPRFPPINGWWFAIFVLLVLVITGLVLYAQTLREKISSYELTLSMENATSFEQHAAIQRIECTGHEVQHCSGLVISDAQNLPARYSCNSTHCAFECGGK